MRGRGALSLLVVAVLAVAVACGVPTDDSPRAVSPEEIPEELAQAPTTTSTPPDAGALAELFFIEAPEGDSVLRVEEATLPDRTARTVLDALVATTPEELPEGVTSSIPEGTAILDTSLEGGVLTIDLSEEFEDVSGDLLIQALGQLVFTASASAGVTDGVLFTVEGEERTFPDGGGSEITGPAVRSDYVALLPET